MEIYMTKKYDRNLNKKERKMSKNNYDENFSRRKRYVKTRQGKTQENYLWRKLRRKFISLELEKAEK